jgi:hypothetical protein
MANQPDKYIMNARFRNKPYAIHFSILFAKPINLLGEDVEYRVPAGPGKPPKVIKVRGATMEDIETLHQYEEELGVTNPHFRLNPEWVRWNDNRKNAESKATRERKRKQEEEKND